MTIRSSRMKVSTMKPFDYYAPETLDDAVEILVQGADDNVYPLAGGTDLFLRARFGEIAPRAVVNLKRIPGLAEVTRADDGSLCIGPLVTLNQLIASPLINEHCPILTQTAGVMASRLIRNLGTIGGNVCRAAHYADLVAPLLVSDASVDIVGPGGKRRVPIAEFYTAPRETVLDAGELVTGVRLPATTTQMQSSYVNHMHREMVDLTIAGVAVFLRFDAQSRVCEEVRIALNAVAPVQQRVPAAEEVLAGAPLTGESIAEVARAAAKAVEPIDDMHASSWYRRKLINVLMRRALEQLVTRE